MHKRIMRSKTSTNIEENTRLQNMKPVKSKNSNRNGFYDERSVPVLFETIHKDKQIF